MSPWLIALGVLLLIACTPVSVWFRYHDGVELKVGLACFRLRLLPKKALTPKQQEKAEQKNKKKAEEKAKKKQKKRAKALIVTQKEAEEAAEPSKPLTDKVAELIPWAKLGASFVGKFCRRKLTVTRLRIRVALTGRDPAKTALTVGRAWQTIGIALPILERAFRIRERKIAVYPDFLAEKTVLEAELRIRLRIGGVVLLALQYGFRALVLWLRQRCHSGKQKQEPTLAENHKEKAG